MTYKVIKYFKDAQDNLYAYKAGDTFPRAGAKVSDERIEELSTDKNKRGFPLIEAVEDKKAPEKVTKTVEEVPEKVTKPAEKPKAKPKTTTTTKKSTTTKGKKKNV